MPHMNESIRTGRCGSGRQSMTPSHFHASLFPVHFRDTYFPLVLQRLELSGQPAPNVVSGTYDRPHDIVRPDRQAP